MSVSNRMNCANTRQQIRASLAGGFEVEATAASHLRECELCQHWHFDELLRQEFDQVDVPAPRDSFVDELIGNAIAQGERSRTWRNSLVATAAVVILSFGLVLGQNLIESSVGEVSFEVTMAPRIGETVEVVINSSTGSDAAMLTIELAENLELDGFPNERIVQWQTGLLKGKNLLRLPLILKDQQNSQFDIALSYGNTQQTITVMVRAIDSIPPRAAFKA